MLSLPIIHIDDEQAWERAGNYKNYVWGRIICPEETLLPFFYRGDLIEKSPSTPSCTIFQIKRVSFSRGVKTVVETTTLTPANVVVVQGTRYHQFYFAADGSESPTLVDGWYEFYIKIVQGTQEFEFKSEIFNYCFNCCPYVAVEGDYDEDDYDSADYYTG